MEEDLIPKVARAESHQARPLTPDLIENQVGKWYPGLVRNIFCQVGNLTYNNLIE